MVVADPLGNIIDVRDASGLQLASYYFWPYGETRTSTGSITNPWQFCGVWGYYFDGNTYYVRARVLGPVVTRWLSLDPLWPLFGPYKYAESSPVLIVDPQGAAPQLRKPKLFDPSRSCQCYPKPRGINVPCPQCSFVERPIAGWPIGQGPPFSWTRQSCYDLACLTYCAKHPNSEKHLIDCAKDPSLLEKVAPCQAGDIGFKECDYLCINGDGCGSSNDPPVKGIGETSPWYCAQECQKRWCCRDMQETRRAAKDLERDLANCNRVHRYKWK